jgi:outer membrane protein assembly factor BamE (lipoprotein component of BamABCDE complex)
MISQQKERNNEITSTKPSQCKYKIIENKQEIPENNKDAIRETRTECRCKGTHRNTEELP